MLLCSIYKSKAGSLHFVTASRVKGCPESASFLMQTACFETKGHEISCCPIRSKSRFCCEGVNSDSGVNSSGRQSGQPHYQNSKSQWRGQRQACKDGQHRRDGVRTESQSGDSVFSLQGLAAGCLPAERNEPAWSYHHPF